MANKFLVIGLGKFGQSVLKELHRLGHDVVGCDRDMDVIDEVENYATYSIEGDATDDSVLEEINVTDFESIIVSMGDNFEAAILIVTKLKNRGCQNILAKANDQLRAQALRAVGATSVILPEEETGIRLAKKISSPGVLDQFDLGPNCSGVEIKVPKEFVGKSLIEINLRKKFNVTLVLINRVGVEFPIISPAAEEVLLADDAIFIVGEDKYIEKLKKRHRS